MVSRRRTREGIGTEETCGEELFLPVPTRVWSNGEFDSIPQTKEQRQVPFAVTSVLHPRLVAGVLGTLIKGLGEDHVLWGTDSVWYGSPQWQIEAFRRIEIPEDLREKRGFAPLGGPDSDVKEKILGKNGAKLYGLNPESAEYRKT